MIKKTSNLMLAFVTLALTLIALTGTTFAWYNITKTADMQISGTVSVGEGLEVALGIDDQILTGYKSNLTANDWQLVMDYIPEYINNPVSTVDGINFSRLRFNYDGLKQSPATKNVDYLEFKVHFRSRTSGEIYFEHYEFTSGGILFEPKTNYAKVGEDVVLVNSFEAYAKDALRLQIENTIYQEGISETNTHLTNNGVYYGQFSYVTEMGNDIYWSNSNDELVKLTKDTITNVTFANALTNINSDQYIAPLIYNENTKMFEAVATITLWIEGFDADAYDAIQGSPISLDIGFIKKNN